ncbi:MAG: condensation domain-containing protein, partial [Xanthomonadales bacterium]|nr:condensation domain-containing protein [Xanthomonadales bacterium]
LKVELSLRTVFESNTIVQLAQAIAASQQDENAEPSIPTVSRKHPLPLSYAQQRLWFVDQLEGSSASYNMPTAVQLDGELNVAALQQAAQAILQRHESLRTRFGIEGDLPRQFIVEDCELELPLVNISHLSGNEQANKVQQLIDEAAAHVFDLSQAPLIRGLLIRCSAQRHILQFTVHHIASDAWSMGVLFNEFMQCYQAMAQDQASPLAPLPLQYADYAHWQRSETQQLRINKAIDYWRRRLHDAPMQLRLPLDHQHPTQADYRGASISHRLSAAQSQQLKDYAQSQQASVFMVLLNVFNAVVQRATGMNDFLIGTDIANREQRDLESLIGFFVNVLPLRAQLNAGDNFDQRLSSLKEHTLDAYQHQQAPFDKLVEVLQPPRQSGVNPLVQALFVMQNTPQNQLDLGALQAQVLNSQHEQSKFDLAVFVEQEYGGALNIRWLYRRSLFEAPTIAQLQQGFESLLDLVAQDSASCLNAWNWTMKTSSNAPSHAATNTASDQPASRKAERKKAKLGKLKRTKAKSVSQAPEQQVKTSILSPHMVDQQRVDQQAEAASQDASSSALPLIIEPKLSELNPIAWAEQARGWVEQQLERHGGLLFRGFSLANAEQFEHFAQALEPTLYGRYGDLPKNNSGKNIYHSTPYPEQQMILYHNESSHMAKWPRKQWFYCEIAPQDRGCTPIVDCRQV